MSNIEIGTGREALNAAIQEIGLKLGRIPLLVPSVDLVSVLEPEVPDTLISGLDGEVIDYGEVTRGALPWTPQLVDAAVYNALRLGITDHESRGGTTIRPFDERRTGQQNYDIWLMAPDRNVYNGRHGFVHLIDPARLEVDAQLATPDPFGNEYPEPWAYVSPNEQPVLGSVQVSLGAIFSHIWQTADSLEEYRATITG